MDLSNRINRNCSLRRATNNETGRPLSKPHRGLLRGRKTVFPFNSINPFNLFSLVVACRLLAISAFLLMVAPAPAGTESGFTSIFDGTSLKGWTLVDKKGAGYGVSNGVIYCALNGG